MAEHSSSLTITYRFERENLPPDEIAVQIDPREIRSAPLMEEPYPEWTRLEFMPCNHCTLKNTAHCPVAVRLHAPFQMFAQVASYTPVTVEVTTPERTYRKKTDMQGGLSSLFGLLMATSGCPSLRYFKLMAHSHLPFSSFEETFYRVASAYLFERLCSGKPVTDRAELLSAVDEIYKNASAVNGGILRRIREAYKGTADSTPNAVTVLSAYSSLMRMTVEEELEAFEARFRHAG